MSSTDTLKYTVIATGVLYTKCFLTNFYQGGKKFPACARVKEDYEATGRPIPDPTSKSVKEAKDELVRWVNISNNDLENIPMGLLVAWSTYLALSTKGMSVSTKSHRLNHGLLALFVSARLAHTVAYAWKKQPARAIMYALGNVAVGGLALLGISHVL
eukprot:gb/GEZN01022844.1/.p1 GENE.gb/GEZN01022844.1/~~gb/GEZN01022844.1/.p1  ORF type:complete len:158 (+),score=11.80 gb/GEZN01022844.1/:44-517(+)